MLKLSKMSDYAVVIIRQLSDNNKKNQNTATIAQLTGLPGPTVSKILHRLNEVGIVSSDRGRFGGYKLQRIPQELPLSELIRAFEGPLVLTDCLDDNGNVCDLETHCAVAGRWDLVSRAINRVLEDITLADIFLDSSKYIGNSKI